MNIIDIIDNQHTIDDDFINNICASFQRCVADIIKDRMRRAIGACNDHIGSVKHFVLAGGVAANQYLNATISQTCQEHGMELVAPPIKLCTDNGAMIAWAGIERFQANLIDPITLTPKARWPLEAL